MARFSSVRRWFAWVALASSPLACTSLLGGFDAEETGNAAGAGGASQGGAGQGGALDASSGSSMACTGCSPNASCVDGACVCKEGFVGDGKACGDVDECATPGFCGPNAACFNTLGSFECTCEPGFAPGASGCIPIWAEVQHLPTYAFGDLGSFVSGAETRVFVANADPNKPFFFAYAPDGNQVFEGLDLPTPEPSFCGCGFRTSLAGIGDTLFAFGSAGQGFDAGKWFSIQAYVDPFRRGEASAAAFEKSVFLLGGRDTASNQDRPSLLEFNAGTMNFLPEKTHPPYVHGAVSMAGMAVLDGRLYVAGGNVIGKAPRLAAVYDIQAGAWTALPDAPFSASPADLVASKAGVFFTDGTKVARLDPSSGTWSTKVFTMPPKLERARLAAAAGQIVAIGNLPDGLHLFALVNPPQ
jgi:hypothetical protein